MSSFLIFAVLLRETHRKIVISGERESNGPVVQLVRMPPCHGGGRGFESRPVRKSHPFGWLFLFSWIQFNRSRW